MDIKIIEINEFYSAYHAKYLLPIKDEKNKIRIYFIDSFFNNQGNVELTIENAKELINGLIEVTK